MKLLSFVTGATALLNNKEIKQAPGAGDAFSGATSRVGSLMQLIEQLKADFNKEYQEANVAYDKQSCAYEDTVKSSEKARNDAADMVKELNLKIKKNSANIAAGKATVEANARDIAAKNKEIEEAIAERTKEHEAYATEVKEFNDCIRSTQLAYEILHNAQTDSQKKTVTNRSPEASALITMQSNLRKLPLNSKIMTVDKIESLNEFLDTRIRQIKDNQSNPNSFMQFGPATQTVLGTIKDMRGQYVAKLQGSQQSEQESASAHVSYVNRARALVKAMTDSMEARQADLDTEKAAKEENLNLRDSKKKEEAEMDTVMRETKIALQELAKEWAETSQSHNDEINGINKAIEYLQSQQGIGAASQKAVDTGSVGSGFMLLQTAEKELAKKPLYQNMFQKIAWAIEDMVKTHQTDLSDNKDQFEQCKTMQAEANSVAARKKAAIAALDRKISELKAESKTTAKNKLKLEGEKTNTETEITTSHTAWEKSDASRKLEIEQLTESVRLILGATDALSSSGSDRMGDVIAILNMLKNECQTSVQQLTKARSSEAGTWAEQKTALSNMVLSLEDDIAKHAQKITNLGIEENKALEKKNKVSAVTPMDMNQCQAFIMNYQAGQDGLNQKIQDLTSAKSHLLGWKNMSTDAEHFDSTATDYVAPPAEG